MNQAAQRRPPAGRWLLALRVAALLVPVLLGACAMRAPPVPAAPPVVPAPPAPEDGPPAAVLAFDRAQRAAAEAAAREARWADAAWAWDIVLAMSPQDTEAQRGRQLATAQLQSVVAERLPQARAARARGQIDLASRLYLDVLALAPGQLEAANALRAIERDRARRQAVGGFARALAPANALPTDAKARAAARRLDLEHASLLAGQGDIDAAIALLLPTPGSRPGDAATRNLLGNLYVQRADALADTDRPGAIAALRQSLRWQPGQPATRQRLNRLLAEAGQAPGRAAPKAAPRQAISKPSSGPSSGR